MPERILITGGAGFVGSHLADKLLAQGYRVRVLDNLAEQVHGKEGWPAYLDKRVEKLLGDVRNADAVAQALQDVDAVFHLAAAVGVGQSMYEINHYTQVNNGGTATLLEALSRQPVKKLVVASSMSLYGEGAYQTDDGEYVEPPPRDDNNLRLGEWELMTNGQLLHPVATPETKTPDPTSVYALSKYDQELMCLLIGRAYGIPSTALRFFNIYGTRQALSNPYTGVLAIFSARYLNNRAPLIFEDGRQRRDFVSVHDVTQFCLRALESDKANNQVFNVGSGQDHSIAEIAAHIGKLLQKEQLTPEISGKFRTGDIRHCFANIDKGNQLLGYQPEVTFANGLAELADWLSRQQAHDQVDRMREELQQRGLSR